MENIDEVVELAGKFLNIQAKVDSEAGFQFIIKDKVRFRIESTADISWINVIADLGEVPTGPYRINLFKAALKANRKGDQPRLGVLCFSEANRHLMMYHEILLQQISKDSFQEFLTPFIDKGCEWYDHIMSGSLPDENFSGGAKPFGM